MIIADLHVHSQYSFDSLSKPRDIVRVALRRGLDAIAITDHNTIRGAVEVRRVAQGSALRVIIGEEIATREGDLIGLFLRHEVKPGSLAKVSEAVRCQGGIVLLPHPYRGHSDQETLVQTADAIEAFNARTTPSENERAIELVSKSGKPGISVSDAHFAREVGNSLTMFNGDDLRMNLLEEEFSLSRRYNPSYLLPVSQIIKVLRQRNYSHWPQHAGRFFARLGKNR